MRDLIVRDIGVLKAIKSIKENRLDPKLLTMEERLSVIYQLRYVEGLQVAEIADMLKVGEATVYRDQIRIQQTHRENMRVAPIDSKAIADDMRARAQVNYAKAMRKGDPVGAMNIWMKMLEKMQSLGLLPKVPEQVQVGPVDEVKEMAEFEQLRKIEVNLNRVIDAKFTARDAGENGTAVAGGGDSGDQPPEPPASGPNGAD